MSDHLVDVSWMTRKERIAQILQELKKFNLETSPGPAKLFRQKSECVAVLSGAKAQRAFLLRAKLHWVAVLPEGLPRDEHLVLRYFEPVDALMRIGPRARIAGPLADNVLHGPSVYHFYSLRALSTFITLWRHAYGRSDQPVDFRQPKIFHVDMTEVDRHVDSIIGNAVAPSDIIDTPTSGYDFSSE